MSANNEQVGGEHYRRHGTLQHWDVVNHFGLDYFQGQITKYVMRWKDKNGLQDLKKARHFLDKYIELAEGESRGESNSVSAWQTVARYVDANARHATKGWRLGEITDQYILTYVLGEVCELLSAPDDIEEMADTLACLIHYALRKGWSEGDVNAAVLRKLSRRFVVSRADS